MAIERTPLALPILLAATLWSHPADSATCPEPPNLVEVDVRAEVSFDPASGLFTYSYDLLNLPASQQDVSRFALDFASPISDVTSPEGWKDSRFDARDTLHWYAFENVPLAPGEPDVGQVLPGAFQIAPGTSLGGFSFRSSRPPGPVSFYVIGFTPVPAAATEAEAELLLEECPQLAGTFFDVAVSGTTEGPVDFVVVEIDIMPGSARNPVNAGARGLIPVAILGGDGFDVADVAVGSLRFGIGGAAPAHAGHPNDVDSDGDEDLVVHFDTQSVDVPCGATDLTLSGETNDGVPIRGSDQIEVVGGRCR